MGHFWYKNIQNYEHQLLSKFFREPKKISQCALFVSPCIPGKAFIHHRMVMIPICLQMREPMLPVLLKLLSFYFKISIVLLLQTYASWLVSNGMLILCRIYTPSSKVTFVDCIHVGNLIPSTTPPPLRGLYTILFHIPEYNLNLFDLYLLRSTAWMWIYMTGLSQPLFS